MNKNLQDLGLEPVADKTSAAALTLRNCALLGPSIYYPRDVFFTEGILQKARCGEVAASPGLARNMLLQEPETGRDCKTARLHNLFQAARKPHASRNTTWHRTLCLKLKSQQEGWVSLFLKAVVGISACLLADVAIMQNRNFGTHTRRRNCISPVCIDGPPFPKAKPIWLDVLHRLCALRCV